jgi:hypothetical protein
MELVRAIKMRLNETYNRVLIDKHLSDTFLIRNGLKLGDALSPLLFNSSLEYVMGKVPENREEMKQNGTHQLLGYADNVNLLRDNINTNKKTT